MFGTVAIGLAYEFKITELYNNLGLDGLCISIDDLSQDKLIEIVTNVIDNIEEYRFKSKKATADYAKEVHKVLSFLPEINT
jgi:polysaccharide pyruvyl transferase WcaK-like protein